MYTLVRNSCDPVKKTLGANFQVLTAVIAVAAASPLEDTPEVAAAKAEFHAAFNAAVNGELAALTPVNNDVQAEQIPNAFLDDDEDVAAAKASFKVAFDNAGAGGLADKQLPAPVHLIPDPQPALVPLVHRYPYGLSYGPYPYGLIHRAFPYRVPAFGVHRIPYNRLQLNSLQWLV